jgi:hypothetical protein
MVSCCSAITKKHHLCNNSPPHPNPQRTATADSGASGIFLAKKDEDLANDLTANNNKYIQVAEGTIIQSQSSGNLRLKGLPHVALPVTVYDKLQGSLLGVGPILDSADATAVLTRSDIKFISPNGDTLLSGPRDPATGLWNINLDNDVIATTAPQSALAARPLPMDSVGDLIAWWHACFCYPAASTFLRALSGWLKDKIPGVNFDNARRHKDRLKSIISAKGHLNQSRQGARSTRDIAPIPRRRTCKDNIIVHMQHREERNDMDIAHLLVDKYLMFFYSSGSNYIHIELFDSRSESHVLQAYKQGMAFFMKKGLKPNVQRLDNEPAFLTDAFQQFQTENDISADRVPPGQHRRNKAERAIETGKHHIIAALAGTDPHFPLKGVKHMMPQIELTLNLLRQSRKDPSISAWEHVHGTYDFNAWPLGPLGCRVLCHEKPDDRPTWGVHGKEGFYVGPTLKHYRCYEVLISATSRVRTTDTLSWHPDTLSTKSSCSHARLDGSLKILHKAVTSLSISDITPATLESYADLDRSLHTLQTQLQTKLAQSATSMRRQASPMTAQRPPKEPDASASCHQLPPAITTNDMPPPAHEQGVTLATANSPQQPHVPEQGVSASRVRSTSPAAEQGVTATTNTPNNRHSSAGAPPPLRNLRRGAKQHNSLTALTAVDLDENGRKLVYHNAIKGPNKEQWERAGGEEIARLFDSGTGHLIHLSDIPRGRKATYYNPRCRIKLKSDGPQFRVRGTAGGDRVTYDGDTAAYTASMQTLKILLNAVVSDNARFATADIKDYYLGTPLVDKHGNPATEYMRINLKHIPAAMQSQYHMADFVHKDHVYVEIHKSIYGLPQSGRLSQDRLIKHLAEHDYIQCPNTPALFRHRHQNFAFTLVVDDFGLKYSNEADLNMFLAVLRQQYVITEDRAATQKYVGITISHDRVNNTIQLAMPGYVHKALKRFEHPTHMGANSPAVYNPPQYGQHIQYEKPDTSPPVQPSARTRLQEIVGVFLFYARAVDSTMLTAVNKLASQQAHPTEHVVAASHRLLQYAARFPSATVTIRPSNMQLMCHSDASYLSEANSRSRAGGVLFLGTHDPGTADRPNGSIDCFSVIIPTVVASAAEAEYAALFLAGREAVSARATLTDLGYSQIAPTIICDNQCAVGIANKAVKQKQSKAIAMRYHWIRDRVASGDLNVTWHPGTTNLADFFTKTHPVHHHLRERCRYVEDDPPPDVTPTT